MPRKQRERQKVIRGRVPSSARSTSKSVNVSISRSGRGNKPRPIPLSQLSERSYAAHDRSLHVLAALRRDPTLTLTRAAELEGVSNRTLKKYVGPELQKVGNRYYVTRSDRRVAYVFLPDERGNTLLRKLTSSKERKQSGAYLADFNRYRRGNIIALKKWRTVKIGGFGLLTDPRTIKASEPEIAEFNLYRAFNGGAA
jgi:hypothetical protein